MTPRTIKQIRSDDRVADFFNEGPDGDSKNNWWLYLKDGYICTTMQSGTIHESTVKECAELLEDVCLKTKEEWIHDHGIESWNATHGIQEKSSIFEIVASLPIGTWVYFTGTRAKKQVTWEMRLMSVDHKQGTAWFGHWSRTSLRIERGSEDIKGSMKNVTVKVTSDTSRKGPERQS